MYTYCNVSPCLHVYLLIMNLTLGLELLIINIIAISVNQPKIIIIILFFFDGYKTALIPPHDRVEHVLHRA